MKEFLAGAAIFGMLAGPLQLAQAQHFRQRTALERVLQNPNLSEKEKEFYKNEKRIMDGAMRPEGRVFYFKRDSAQVGKQWAYFNVEADYSCGPRGGNGTLNLRFYLDEDGGWYNEKGIGNLAWELMTAKRPKISKRVYEVNVNHYAKTTNYVPVEQRLIVASYMFSKSQDMLYQVAKKIKIDKKDIEKIFYWWSVKKELTDYAHNQEYIQFMNLRTLDHIYLTEIFYEGCSRLDLKGNIGESLGAPRGTQRASKLVKIEIPTGELEIAGFNVHGYLFDFSENPITINKETGYFSLTDTLNVAGTAKAMGVDVAQKVIDDDTTSVEE